jgi:hypothetical protein
MTLVHSDNFLGGPQEIGVLSYSLCILYVRKSGTDNDGLWGLTAGVRFSAGTRDFLFSTASKPALGSTQPHIQSVLRGLPPEVKRPGHEADPSPPSCADVKNDGAIPPLPTS